MRKDRTSTVWISGLGLALILVASHAATQPPEAADFNKAKIEYIKKYAWPKRERIAEDQLFEKHRAAPTEASRTANAGAPIAPHGSNSQNNGANGAVIPPSPSLPSGGAESNESPNN